MPLETAVHVGFPKTGTTTLQKHLFSRHSQILYLGKPYNDDALKTQMHRLIMQESLVYDPAELKELLKKELSKQTDDSKKIILLSEELLVSCTKTRDKGLVARRLKEVFQPAKVLFTIRNQFETLKSAYLTRGRVLLYVPERYSGLHVTLDEWLEVSYKNLERSYLGHIDYFKTVDYYAKLLGKENIGVLLLEELVHTPGEFIKKLSAFLGIDADQGLQLLKGKRANIGTGHIQLEAEALRSKWHPLSNFFLVSKMLKVYLALKKNVKKKKSAEIPISDDWIERLRQLYTKGNQQLAGKYELPLENYGYPI
jgi:hypothetical protein